MSSSVYQTPVTRFVEKLFFSSIVHIGYVVFYTHFYFDFYRYFLSMV